MLDFVLILKPLFLDLAKYLSLILFEAVFVATLYFLGMVFDKTVRFIFD